MKGIDGGKTTVSGPFTTEGLEKEKAKAAESARPFVALDEVLESLSGRLQDLRGEVQELYGGLFSSNPNHYREVDEQLWHQGDGWRGRTMNRLLCLGQEVNYLTVLTEEVRVSLLGVGEKAKAEVEVVDR